MAGVPSKLFRKLDSLLTEAEQIKSLLNSGPKFKYLSADIRKTKIVFDNEISKMLDSLSSISTSLMACATGFDPNDKKCEMVIKKTIDRQQEVTTKMTKLLHLQRR